MLEVTVRAAEIELRDTGDFVHGVIAILSLKGDGRKGM